MKINLLSANTKFLLLILCIYTSTGAIAQNQRVVTGTVLSASDNGPLIGATVLEQGTTNGTISRITKYSR